MVKLRLWRMGAKKRPVYRIVAIDSRAKLGGEYIEQLGTFNPLNEDVKISEEITLKWLKNGAEPSDTVRKILSQNGIMKKFNDTKTSK